MKNFTRLSSHTVALSTHRSSEKALPIFLRFFLQIVLSAILTLPGKSSLAQSYAPGLASRNQVTPAIEKTVRSTLKQSSLKLQLIENDGQQGLPQNVVAYFSSGNQMVFIEKDKLKVVVLESKHDQQDPYPKDKSLINEKQKEYRYNSFDILFKGSSGFTSFQKINPLTTKRNFINARASDQNRVNVSCYGEIILKNIYPGTDLRLYSQENGQLEFDWIVSAGADAALIKMKFEGQKQLWIADNGSLSVTLPMGNFQMHLPESYYVTPAGKMQMNLHFLLSGNNEVQFGGFKNRINKYPLVIDPDLLWGTYFDGDNFNFDQYLYGIDFDVNNNLLYCTGAANRQVSTAYAAALTGAYNGTFSAVTDAIIYALTKDGQFVQYITYLGGGDEDVGIGVSISPSFVFISGFTASSDFPLTKSSGATVQAFDTVYHGNDEGFVAAFNLSLNTLVYCSYLGGPGTAKALTIRAVSDSSYYISLISTDTLSRTPTDYLVSSADSTFGGGSDGWIGEFNSLNQLRFGTYIGGNNNDLVNDFQVLSTGDVVFVGNTFGITEINAVVPNAGFGRDVLFGKIHVPASGPVSFDIIEKIGGNGEDYGWGICNLGDTVSVIVGQTSSSDFPLGSGPSFQNVNNGNSDGFIARINNDGSGGYQASYVGGSDDDILVCVRPVFINNWPVLLAFGTTKSNDLAAINTTGGTFYSSANSGGYDMMWLMCNLNVTYKYYLSYIGGSNNDYLGQTGAPVGANHLFYNMADSVIYLGTTTHSEQTTQSPLFEGRGPGDLVNGGVPVFDSTKDNSNNDTHTIIAISIRKLFYILPVNWQKFDASVLSDCSVELTWQTGNATDIKQYTVERSMDGRNFTGIANLPAAGTSFSFHDNTLSKNFSKVNYRIAAETIAGKEIYSTVNAVQLCQQQQQVRIYPTITNNFVVISGSYGQQVKKLSVEVVDASGRKIMITQLPVINGSQTLYFNRKPAPGSYFIVVRNEQTNEILHTQKITVGI